MALLREDTILWFSCSFSSSAALELQHLKIENWNEFGPFLLSLGDVGER
jgi:hypothetical protein